MWFFQRRRLPHYAWLILLCVMVIMAITAMMRFSFGVMIDSLVEEYGWSRGAVSFTYSLQFLIGIPVVIVAGWLAEKIGSRRIILTGAALSMAGLLLTATIKQSWQFQLYYGIIVGVGTSTFVTLLPVMVTRWFHQKLGLAMGFFWASLSLGPAVLSPLLRWTLESVGWRETFIMMGFILGGLMLVSAFFLRNSPREKNLTAYGEPAIGLPQVGMAPSIGTLRSRNFMALPGFLALTGVHFLGCVSHSVPLAHVVSIATFAGIPGVAAAGILSIAMMVSLTSRFGMPLVAEAKGARFTLTIALLVQSLPILILLSARELWSFYSFALLFGVGFGGEMVGFPIFNRQYYGKDAPLTMIYSYQMAGANLGMALGGWLGGVLFDITGAYMWSILVAAGSGLVGVLVVLMLPPHRR